ncbi:MAG: hypothetical protein EGP74_07230 [Alistipes finegoldii]|nr:hypothetical protein [Alistipes finegoldii]
MRCRLFPASCLLFPASCLLFPAGCLLFPAGCLLFPAGCLLFPAGCLLFPAGCLLFPAGCLLFSFGSCCLVRYRLSCAASGIPSASGYFPAGTGAACRRSLQKKSRMFVPFRIFSYI